MFFLKRAVPAFGIAMIILSTGCAGSNGGNLMLPQTNGVRPAQYGTPSAPNAGRGMHTMMATNPAANCAAPRYVDSAGNCVDSEAVQSPSLPPPSYLVPEPIFVGGGSKWYICNANLGQCPNPTPRPSSPTLNTTCAKGQGAAADAANIRMRNGAMESVNQIIASSPQLQSLVANLANNGISIGIQVDTQSAGYASGILNSATSNVDFFSSDYADPAHEYIIVNVNDFNADVAAGADPAELLYHEFDHFQEQLLGALAPGPLYAAGATGGFASIGGYTFGYDIAPIPGSSPGFLRASNGYDGLVHMAIHDDIMNAFGVDTTAALEEGLAKSTTPPANLGAMVAQLRGQSANLSTTLKSGAANSLQLGNPPKNVTCSHSVSTQSVMLGRSSQFEPGRY